LFDICFNTVCWAAGRASGLLKTEWWGAGVVICLECTFAYGPADSTATHYLFAPGWFYFSGTSSPG